MRIGITLQSLDPTWGGIGIYTEEIVRSLLKYDSHNEYILMYPGFGAARKLRGQYRRFKRATEVETEFSRVPSGWYWDQFVVPKVARDHHIDVLFNPFLSVPIRGHFKKVMIMHNVEYHTVPKVYDFRMYVRWFLLEKMIMPAADRIISISRVMTEDFRRCVKYPIKQVQTIYHGVSSKFRVIRDATALAAAREEYELPEKFILFVGHLYPQKNFSVLVRALHRLRDEIPHQLVVAGRPRWKHDADLARVEQLGLSDRVIFLYYVPNDHLPAIYNLADCFIYPSLYESFGLAQLEAMACGCPVIGARAGAIPEISGDAAILFEPHSDEELADSILGLVSSPDRRARYVAKGLERAKLFPWEKTASETLALLEEVAAPALMMPGRARPESSTTSNRSGLVSNVPGTETHPLRSP